MARINVEQKALTDPRFYRLGIELGADPKHAHAVGLFAMIKAWNECIERGKYALEEWVFDALFGVSGAADLIVTSDLGERQAKGGLRVRGTRGRIEYLEEKRRNGRKYGHLGAGHGVKGGRPKKTRSGGFENPVWGIGENPPPAPAPALIPPTPVERGERAPFEAVFEAYPVHRRTNRRAAERAWADIDPATSPAIVAGIAAWAKSEEWQRDGGRWIPTLAKFLAGRMWEATPASPSAGPTSDEVEARMLARRRAAAEERARIEEEQRGQSQ